MSEEKFCTIAEAAALENISYEAMKKKLQRNSDNYITSIEKAETGGKERTLIDINSLSSKAKKLYKAKKKVELLNDQDESDWYLDIDINWYIENNKNYYYKAIELAGTIEKYLEENKSAENKAELLAKYKQITGMSQRSFYRKVEAYLKGLSWADEMSNVNGKTYEYYKILAISRKPSQTNKFNSMSLEVKAFIENMWSNPMFAQNQNHIMRIYEALLIKKNEKGWEVPHYSTIARYARYLKDITGNKRDILVKESKKFIAENVLKARRDPGALQVMEVVMGDGHTFDCWVSVTRDNGKVDAVKPKLLAWIDLRSRCIVSHAICEVPDKYIMSKTIVNMIYPKQDEEIPFEGVPKYLYIDNGKEYTSEYLLGRNRKERCDTSSEVKGFCRGVGIIDDIRAIPYHSWSKSYIERNFGGVCSRFTKTLESYVGTLTGSKTSAKIKKDIPKMLKEGKLLTIEEFAEKFNTWLNEIYHKGIHSGLKRQKEQTPIPLDVFKNAERYYKPAPPHEYIETLLPELRGVRVYNTGIERFGVTYVAPELGGFIGDQKVNVRYNPDDITKIHVYTLDGKKICDAVSYELLKIAPKMGEKQYKEFAKLIGNQTKEAKEAMKLLQMPYEERVLKSKTLIMPEIKSENPKVVALPIDEQFKNEILANNKNKKKSPGKGKEQLKNNEFFERQAEEAFAMLENL